MVVELILFEPLECLWIHFQVPRLVRAEVEEAVRILYHSVDTALSNNYLTDLVLDVPQYFFVSTQVAKHHSHLFESSIVRAFQTCLGGRLVLALRERTIERFIRKKTDNWWIIIKRFVNACSARSIVLVVACLQLQMQR
jgi:hypothetical protein